MNNAKTPRCFAITDAVRGAAVGTFARRLAASISSGGSPTLLIYASSYLGADGVRCLSETTDHLSHLCGEALLGYFSSGGLAFGEVLIDAPLGQEVFQRIIQPYVAVLFVLGGGDVGVASFLAPVPAAVFARANGRTSLADAKRLIDRLLEDEGLPNPVGFILEGADRIVAARLADRWRLPFWGFADDSAHIAARIMERAIAISNTSTSPSSQPLHIKAPAPPVVGRALVREALDALRVDPEFKDIRIRRGDREATEKLRTRVTIATRRFLAEVDPSRLAANSEEVVQKIVDDAVGFGPVEVLLADPHVTEIMINGFDKVYVEREGIVEEVPNGFVDNDHLLAVIERMVAQAGRRVDESSPMVDARLPDGSRLNVVLPPLAVNGPTVTVRKFVGRIRDLEAIIENGMIPRSSADFLAACVRARVSIVVSGGTGAGKTTLLNVFASAIDPHERIVTIEDAAELKLDAPHVVRLESRPPNIEGAGQVTIRDLVKNALRMRPDRIIVGECRGPEALDMLQAMNTGHEGSLTTVHANSPRDALSRIETMILMAGMDLPLQTVREQIVRAIDIIVQVSRVRNGARRVVEIAEVTGMEGQTMCMQTLATMSEKGVLVETGLAPRIAERLSEKRGSPL